MDEVYVCQHCGKESADEQDFQLDLDRGVGLRDLTCETCYDEMYPGRG